MTENRNHDFAMERRLRALNPGLHRRFADAVIALQYNLSHYKRLFPSTPTTPISIPWLSFVGNGITGELSQ